MSSFLRFHHTGASHAETPRPSLPPPLSEDDVQVDDEVGRDTTHDGMLSDALRDNICADLYDDVCADGTDSVCVRVRMADQILLHVGVVRFVCVCVCMCVCMSGWGGG
jgi:hypothetical protein